MFAVRLVALRAQVDDGGIVGQGEEGVSQTLGQLDGVVGLIVQARRSD